MRKTSVIQGGTYERPYGGTIDMPTQHVRVIRAHERRRDEDIYVVTSMIDNREVLVPGDELKPHPEDPETNVEFVERIMEFSRAGALIQPFVLTALEKYAQQVKQMPQEQRDQMDRGMIAFAAWERCADEVLQAIGDRAKERR